MEMMKVYQRHILNENANAKRMYENGASKKK